MKSNIRKDLINIIKARKKNKYKYLFEQSQKMLSLCWDVLDKHKEYKMISEIADFRDCSMSKECDHLLTD